MKRTFIIAIIGALLSISAIAAIMPEYKTAFDFPRKLGVERVTHYDPRVNFARIDDIVYLETAQATKFRGVGRGGYAPFYARGTAKLRSSVLASYPSAEVSLTTKDLPQSSEVNSQFEVWLVDDDTGYRLSLGTFTTQFGGVGRFRWRSTTYLDPYDVIEVTLEPFDDLDLNPGPPLLIAAMPHPTFFYPAPKQAKMANSAFKKV